MDRWDEIDSLFAEALERPPEDRDAFLRDACDGDAALRDEVEDLLAAHRTADTFLDDSVESHASALWEGFSEEVIPDDEEPGDTSGRRVGAWRLLEEIGRGGMGVVYAAERADGAFEQRAAVKLLRLGLTTEDLVRRFETERQVLASLQHPHIARLYDGGVTEDGTPWFAMEYVEGRPITDYCNEHGLPLNERLKLFVKVCRAVQHAHNRLIIHRDLKPSNILVTHTKAGGEPRLLDFGLAKVLGDSTGDAATTGPGRRWMTLDYASPEQVRGDPVGTPSDTYQLGLVLYELLTGQRAYTVKGLSPTEAERIICDVDPPKPSTAIVDEEQGETRRGAPLPPEKLRRKLKGDLDTIIAKALHKDPARGYASAETLANDIERHLQGLPIEARPDTLGYRSRKFVTRHRVGVAAAVAVAVALVGGLGGALWQARRATENARRAAAEQRKAEQVTTFLTELFRANDPTVALNDTLTTYELVEQGVEQAEALGDQPELQAELFSVTAGIYSNLGDYERATDLYRRSLSAWETLDVHGEHDEARVRTLYRVGVALSRLGRYGEAEPHLRQVVDERSSAGVGDPLRRDALFALFEALHNLDREEAANRVFETWKSEVERAPLAGDGGNPDRLLTMADVLARKGHIRGNLADVRRALELTERALRLFRKNLGPQHPSVALALNKWMYFLDLERGLAGTAPERLALADSVSRRALELHRAIYTTPNPALAVSLSGRADVLRDLERFSEAEALIREAMAIDDSLYGRESEYRFTHIEELAYLAFDRGNYARAFEQLTRVRDHWAQKYGEDYLFTLTRDLSLGGILTAAGRFEEAEARLLSAYQTLEEDRGREDWFTQDAILYLAELYEAWGKPEEARRYRNRLSSAASTPQETEGGR